MTGPASTRLLLDRDACLHLLASNDRGALGLSVGALPVVLRVQYRMVAGRVLFRVSEDDGAARAVHDAVVALEVGGVRAADEWSVLVQGPSRRIDETPKPLPEPLPGHGDHVVMLVPQLVRGYVRPLPGH